MGVYFRRAWVYSSAKNGGRALMSLIYGSGKDEVGFRRDGSRI